MRGGMLFQTGDEAFVKLCELLFLVLFEGFDYFEIIHFKIFFLVCFIISFLKVVFIIFSLYLYRSLLKQHQAWLF